MANRKPPSRIRYEESHPVVSFRTNKEIQDRASRLKDIEGISHADIFQMGLEKYEAKIEKEEEIRKEAFDEGFQEGDISGITSAQEVYLVTYRCSVCGGEIWVDTPEQRAAAGRYMEEHGWAHGACLEKKR